ncbi:MAG: hypothetical protein QXL22_04750 [Candidatus Nezhaarchaeales archaeon]
MRTTHQNRPLTRRLRGGSRKGVEELEEDNLAIAFKALQMEHELWERNRGSGKPEEKLKMIEDIISIAKLLKEEIKDSLRPKMPP